MFESKKKKIIPTYKIVNEYVSSNCYLAYKTDDDVYYCPQYPFSVFHVSSQPGASGKLYMK